MTLKKLVRDRIDERMERLGIKDCEFSLATETTWTMDHWLREKLTEEAAEVYSAPTRAELIEEMADALEVIEALAKHHRISMATVREVQEAKRGSRGGFERGLVMTRKYPEDRQVPAWAPTGSRADRP